MTQMETFATAANCMDGRALMATTALLTSMFGVTYVDSITEPGMDKYFSEAGDVKFEALRKKIVDISVGHHGSRVVAIVGHDECAGYPVSKDEHFASMTSSLNRMYRWDFLVDEPITLLSIWVSKVDDVWTAEIVEKLIKEVKKETVAA